MRVPLWLVVFANDHFEHIQYMNLNIQTSCRKPHSIHWALPSEASCPLGWILGPKPQLLPLLTVGQRVPQTPSLKKKFSLNKNWIRTWPACGQRVPSTVQVALLSATWPQLALVVNQRIPCLTVLSNSVSQSCLQNLYSSFLFWQLLRASEFRHFLLVVVAFPFGWKRIGRLAGCCALWTLRIWNCCLLETVFSGR